MANRKGLSNAERVRLKSAAFEVKTGPSINGLVLMCAARSVDGKHDVDS